MNKALITTTTRKSNENRELSSINRGDEFDTNNINNINYQIEIEPYLNEVNCISLMFNISKDYTS
jgi:hypothetical protein